MQSPKPIELIILPPFNIEYRCGTVAFILLHTGMQVNYKEFFLCFILLSVKYLCNTHKSQILTERSCFSFPGSLTLIL